MFQGTGKLATKFGLTKHIVRKLAEAGLVNYVKTAGGHLKVSEKSLVEYLESGRC